MQTSRASIVAACFVLAACNGPSEPANGAQAQQAAALAKCRARTPPWRQEVQQALAAGQHELAVTLAADCAELAGDAALLKQLADARIKWRTTDALNGRLPADFRLAALDALQALSPEAAGALPPKLREQLQRQAQREATAEAKRVKDERKKHGVRIGMTADEVLDSSWGKPRSVNRTTTANRVHEQWVYDGGNYLYFDDGKVSAIQN